MADTANSIAAKLTAELARIKGQSIAGLLEVGLRVERDAKLKVPREYGALVGSGYTQKSPSVEGAVEVGFTSDYAVYVHENLEQKLKGQPRPSGKGVYWGPDGEPRFLAKAADKAVEYAAEVIAKHAAVKGGDQ